MYSILILSLCFVDLALHRGPIAESSSQGGGTSLLWTQPAFCLAVDETFSTCLVKLASFCSTTPQSLMLSIYSIISSESPETYSVASFISMSFSISDEYKLAPIIDHIIL